MASPRTGRPRGRPRKPKAPKALRRRGRPAKPVTADPWRYWLALYQAHVDSHRLSGAAHSELKVAEMFAALRYGELDGSPENVAALLAGRPTRFVFTGDESLQRANPDSAVWRDKNHFRPLADDMRRKARRLANDPWFQAMTMALRFCLEGRAATVDFVEHLARSVGEEDFFVGFMLPLLIERARQRSLGYEKSKNSLARFNSIFVPTTEPKICE